MRTVVVPVYPSQLDAFKEKADILADKIKQSLNIKVSKFKRYEYLARGIGHVKGHDRLIESAKLIAQADKHESLILFSDPVICNQIGTVFKFHYNQDIAREVQKICKELGTHEVIMANTSSHLLIDDMSFSATEEYKQIHQLATGGDSKSLPPKSMTVGETLAEKRRGREFVGIYDRVKYIISNDIRPEPNTQYELQLLANKIYGLLGSTKGFSSLDLAGLILDNNRKLGVSLYLNNEAAQPNLPPSDILPQLENYHFEGPVSKMQFMAAKGESHSFDSVAQETLVDDEKEAFFEQLSKDMDQQTLATLQEQLPKMDKRVPEQWCQYIMLEHFIPQKRAADFLKDEFGVTIDLLPEPDINISVTNPDGSNALNEGYSLLDVTEEQSSVILEWMRNKHYEGTAFDNKITDQINEFLIDTFHKSDHELMVQYATKTPLKDITFDLQGNQLKVPNKYFVF